MRPSSSVLKIVLPLLGVAAVTAVLLSQPRRGPVAPSSARHPAVSASESVTLADGDVFELTADEVVQSINGVSNTMLAYNGSIPGPTLRVQQGSEVNVRFRNSLDEPSTVHWHGVRVTSGNDGMPRLDDARGGHSMQDDPSLQSPVAPGETFEYRLRFPDPGAYWYHPHIREDRQQDLGMYGMIIVEPTDVGYWPQASAEATVFLDDVLASGGFLAPHHDDLVDYALMGRYGNTYLTNGKEQAALSARVGEPTRLYVVNVANARPFRFTIDGAEMLLIGSDGGREAKPRAVEAVVLGPSERAVLQATFRASGEYPFFNQTPEREHRLGAFTVTDGGTDVVAKPQPRDADFASIRPHLQKAVDATWRFVVAMNHRMPGMSGMHGASGDDGIEWEDDMGMMNAHMTQESTTWKIVDAATGSANMAISTRWQTGTYVKLRLENPADGDHPMQHPFHIHGQRFVVAAVNGVPNEALAWKDTVLVPRGTTMDVVVEVSNPGSWMAHCHIAEHLEAGMATMITVTGDDLVPMP